jgi:phosphatidylserine decarboxylase
VPTPAWLQYLLPKQSLTRAAGALARREAGALTTWAIRRFIARYRVDMTEAADPDPATYPSFNAFFTRALRDGARPIAPDGWLCPVDGAISQCGPITGDRILQAKGHDYSAAALLGGDPALAAAFQGGHFATIYLSPRDYHRIHMPAAGRLLRMIHVPGDLFSVNPTTVASVPGLFARNERVVCVFEGDDGRPFALVLVGATIVGSIATVWHGVVTPPRSGGVREWRHDGIVPSAAAEVRLARGAEMGRFLLGSTVVLLWPPGPLRLARHWAPGVPVRLGERMAQSGTPAAAG